MLPPKRRDCDATASPPVELSTRRPHAVGRSRNFSLRTSRLRTDTCLETQRPQRTPRTQRPIFRAALRPSAQKAAMPRLEIGSDYCFVGAASSGYSHQFLCVLSVPCVLCVKMMGMPIYEYECKQCGQRFEALVSASTKASCPSCQNEQLDRMLSVFAVGGASPKSSFSTAPGPCGSCGDPRGPGACSIN
jgi:putative FmdB family regulatory protein